MITDVASLGAPLRGLGTVEESTAKSARTKSEGNSPLKESKAGEKTGQSFGSVFERANSTSSKKMETKKSDPSSEGVPKNEKTTVANESVEKVKKDGDEGEVETKIKGESKKTLGSRQKVMQKFMDSMESELSIPPTRIAEAMTKIDEQEQIKSPEDSAVSVISQLSNELDLSPEQEDRAMELYVGMLAGLGTLSSQIPNIPQKQTLIPTEESLNSFLMQKKSAGLSSGERRNLLNQSLDQMNNKFWSVQAPVQTKPTQVTDSEELGINKNLNINPDQVPIDFYQPQEVARMDFYPPASLVGNKNYGMQDLAQENAYSMQQVMPVEEYSLSAESMLSNNGQLGLNELNSKSPELYTQSSNATVNPKDAASTATLGALLSKLDKSMQDLSNPSYQLESTVVENGLAKTETMPIYAKPGGGFSLVGPSMTAVADTSLSQNNNFSNQQGFSGNFGDTLSQNFGDSAKLKTQSKMTASDSTSGSDFFIDPAQMQNASGQTVAKADGSEVTTAFMTPNERVQQAQQDPNIRQVLNQAQYLVKKGGGEMKVQMTPEGLGRVDLKVLVQDGKVSVQMNAETKEAKNMIENSIQDLKANLTSHKLSVDQIKVDVSHHSANTDSNSNQNNQQSNQQLEMNLRQGSERDNARQFMQQFREQNSARNGGFFETPGIKAYGSKKHDPIGPAPVERPRRMDGKGQGLNLVA